MIDPLYIFKACPNLKSIDGLDRDGNPLKIGSHYLASEILERPIEKTRASRPNSRAYRPKSRVERSRSRPSHPPHELEMNSSELVSKMDISQIESHLAALVSQVGTNRECLHLRDQGVQTSNPALHESSATQTAPVAVSVKKQTRIPTTARASTNDMPMRQLEFNETVGILGAFEKEEQRLRDEHLVYAKRIAGLTHQLADMHAVQQQRDSIAIEHGKLKDELSALKAQKIDIEARCAELEKQQVNDRKAFEQALAGTSQANATIQDLDVTVKKLQHDVQRCERDVEKARGLTCDMQAERDHALRQVKQAKQEGTGISGKFLKEREKYVNSTAKVLSTYAVAIAS